MRTILKITIFLSLFLNISNSHAGSGYYLGADYLINSIKLETRATSNILGVVETAKNSEDSRTNNYGLRFGYRHKIHEYGFISPELFYQAIDQGHLYSTTIKAGIAIKDFSFFGSIGYAEIDEFNNSSENYGVGLEYKINDNFSVGAEYIKFGDVRTTDIEYSNVGTITTDKFNQLNTIKFGVTYYFHE